MKQPRRTFIKQSALLTGSALVPGWYRNHHSGMQEKPLRFKSLKFGMIQEGTSVLEKFLAAKDAGFQGIELDWPNDLNTREVLEAQEKTGMKIPGIINSVHWKQPLSDPDPAVRQACVQATIEGLHYCKQMGGTTVLLVPAVVNEKVSYAEAWDRSIPEIRKILPAAQVTGVRIAIENVWNNFLLSPLEAARYIDTFEDDMIGWYMDVGNLVRYAWPDQWIRILGSRILKVDIKGYSRKKQVEEGIWKGFEVEIGDDDCNWSAVNNALQAAGYSAGWGSAEVKGGDLARLKDISRRMDDIFTR